MADQSPNQKNYTRTVPSLFGSPKFRDFTTKCLSGAEALRSPTSILDTRALSPFGTEPIMNSPRMQSEKRSSWEWDKVDSNSKGIGLALQHKPSNKKVLFGTELRVKIPPLSKTCECDAADFGSKIKDSQMGVMSLSEMELSEEYTCVISHGPNPKTTHIFDNCVVERFCSLSSNQVQNSPSLNFLYSCYTCKKHLEQTKDIYIYRYVGSIFNTLNQN